ncbi:MAG: hypothetical protein ACLQJF_19880 [Candidatus Sulfotelmatobacter sp.]
MDDLLKLELQLLLLKYGRGKILDALGALSDRTAEQVEAEIAALEARRTKRVRKVPSISDILTEVCNARPEADQILRTLASRYENRTFLPQLKDVQRFLDRSGLAHKALRSRRDAAQHVLRALSRLPTDELNQLAKLSTGKSNTDYADLAREIMGRRS